EKDFVPRNDRPEEHVAETTTDWRKDDSDCWATLKLFHSANTADKKAMITAYPDIQAEYDAAKAFVALNDFIGWRREVIRNNGATKTQRDAR
ncbi:MAG: hypothetical protein NTY53_23145, partial [Kiritimatiellaeota bacterium]|nr:hypothetical protein [Kiritimatiellota bacterium]